MKERILLLAGLMTSKTTLGILFGIRAKRKDQFVRSQRFRLISPCSLLSFNMGLPGTMTGFATHDDLLVQCQTRMGRLAVLDNFGAVATPAPIITDKSVGGSRRRRRSKPHGWTRRRS